MMNIASLVPRKLDLNGLKTLIDWARIEGWNPGRHDAEVFWATDPDGFYGFFEGENLLAGGGIVSYQHDYGFMGLFIVHPLYREQGIGRKLWNFRRDRLLERLKPGATIGMDGVLAMQPFYQQGGFEILFKDERYENIGIESPLDLNISKITDDDFESILEFDRQCFGFSRSKFLKPWLQLPESFTFQYKIDNTLKGYAVLRKVNSGFKIGPLFSEGADVAEALYKACLNAVPGQSVYIDIPMVNQAAIDLVKKFNSKYVFECARMYYGKPPLVDIHKVFGITTFELG